jgi:hypothetical protein
MEDIVAEFAGHGQQKLFYLCRCPVNLFVDQARTTRLESTNHFTHRRGAIYRALIYRALICLIEHGRDVGNMGAMNRAPTVPDCNRLA